MADLKTIVSGAIAHPPGPERLAYLDAACRGDATLRAQAEALLGDAEHLGRLLASASAAEPGELTVSLEPGSPSTLGELAHSLGALPRALLSQTPTEGENTGAITDAASADLPIPLNRTGRYELFGEIARGGMGAVLRARDPDLGRELAVKVLLERHRDNPDLLRRFIEEAQVGGQLQHPGIVPVYDVGRFADLRPFFAMKELRIGHRLGSKRPNWEYPTGEWLAELERKAALAERLPALLRGEDKPRDNGERLGFAQISYERGHQTTAVRPWDEAFAADPTADDDRRTQPRYNAACAAALAASGRANDAPSLDEAARARLRGQALGALRIELDTWAKLIQANPQALPTAQRYLWHWQQDPGLGAVRDPQPLAKLPRAEQAAWKTLWDDVASRAR